MRFRILGPLRVRTSGGWEPVAAERQRLILAVLLADAGRAVSIESLVDAVWGERPPAGATNTVRVYVMRLRRLLGEGVLNTRGRGYELLAGPNDIDAGVFQRLASSGRSEVDKGRPQAGAARLAKALALWRGPAFADVPASPSLTSRVAYLEQLHLSAEEDHIAALLDLDRHAEVVDELHRLVEQNPLRERRWALLMRSLHRCGRRAEALDAFHRARDVLLDELGLDPGTELRELQRAILDDEPEGGTAKIPVAKNSMAEMSMAEMSMAEMSTAEMSTAETSTAEMPMVENSRVARSAKGKPSGPAEREQPPPAQLPADVPGFTAREAHLARLDMLPRNEDQTVVVAVTGTAGVGKTALAVHWAHRVRERFRDGQLYANLRGYSEVPPVRPIEALGWFLRALNVPAERIPSDVDEASALFRSLLAGKRMLVLLDNARDPEQVRPLLPGSPGCLALVTSRDRLDGLIARDGAVPAAMDVFDEDEAQALLAGLLDEDRLRAEPKAAQQLAELCGHLPLALRIAAANLAASPHGGIDEYVQRLRVDRLGRLRAGADGVRAAFELSYIHLPADTRKLFRMLGLVPGPDVTAAAAAQLCGGDIADGERHLERLTTAHLIEEHAPGRYTMHDLLRLYSAELATASDSEGQRQASLDRLYDHYQRHVDSAVDTLYPELMRLPQRQTGRVIFDRAAAMAWLDAEKSNVVATVLHTQHHGPRYVAWQLADALRGYLRFQPAADWLAVAEAGLAAAQSDGDRHAVAASHFSLATYYSARNRTEEAIEHHRLAAGAAEEAGWTQAVAAALAGIGSEFFMRGELEQAEEHYSRSLAMRRELGWLAGEATILDNLGIVHFGLGRLELAAQHYSHAAILHRFQGATLAEARANADLGEAYYMLGRFDDALKTLTSAIAILGEFGDRRYLGYAECQLSELESELGHYSRALKLATSGRGHARASGDRSLECHALAALARAHQNLGDLQRAVRQADAGITLSRDVGDRIMETMLLIRSASAHRARAETDGAFSRAGQALELARSGRYRVFEGQALTVLAELHLDRGETGRAAELASKAAEILAETGHLRGQQRASLVGTGSGSHPGVNFEL
ncbi:MAG TPA: BTAD domain-containing putative transcriptional regulator [Candidatus Limnocylindrales bacterium]|nr:BTAD domain-containing putative transcriptional regulator [Candidatus Limnocylindrales bacterium]